MGKHIHLKSLPYWTIWRVSCLCHPSNRRTSNGRTHCEEPVVEPELPIEEGSPLWNLERIEPVDGESHQMMNDEDENEDQP